MGLPVWVSKCEVSRVKSHELMGVKLTHLELLEGKLKSVTRMSIQQVSVPPPVEQKSHICDILIFPSFVGRRAYEVKVKHLNNK